MFAFRQSSLRLSSVGYREFGVKSSTAVTSQSYLSDSESHTESLQDSLPRLPIPDLEDTCQRYLTSLQPLVSSESLQTSSKLVNDFKKGKGRELHERLLNLDTTLDRRYSYIHEGWTEMYQGDRGSVLLNQNPVLTYQDEVDSALNNQLDRAANLTISTLRYFCSLRDGKLTPLKTCMLQYPYLFQSTRIPRRLRDENVRFPDSSHILVIHKGHYYKVDVIDSDGGVRDTAAMKSAISQILADTRPVKTDAVGYFTALERDPWADIRLKLEHGNRQSLNIIDQAIFVLCLDAKSTPNPREGLKNCLVGDGYNRWMDKSFSLIVSEDGRAAVNWEHSWGDGGTIMEMLQNVHRDYCDHRAVIGGDGKCEVERVEVVVEGEVRDHLEVAKRKFEHAAATYDLKPFLFEGFGKEDIKRFGMSPDSVSQFIFQLAQWRTFGYFVGTYESCSTAGFRSGRTETIRSCTSEMAAASRAFDLENPASLEEITSLLKGVSAKHVTLCREAAGGMGFDRHFFGLRYLNKTEGGSDLEVFQDPNWATMGDIRLSTSTVGAPCLRDFLCFGAVSPQGFGLGYLMDKSQFGAALTCYLPNDYYSAYYDNLGSACENIKAVMEGKNFKERRRI